MWEKGVTWLLAFLALASSAGWLARGRTRRLRRLRMESEVLGYLSPDNPARPALNAHVAASVEEYLRERAQRDLMPSLGLAIVGSQIIAALMLIVGGIGGAGLFSWEDGPLWARVVSSGGIAVAFCAAVALCVSLLWENWLTESSKR